MYKLKHYFYFFLTLILFCFPIKTYSENHNLNEIIKLIQKDLKTLERAVYSENFSSNQDSNEDGSEISQNSEEVLTRHLLKLSEIEKQFQELTNRFEEINFKLDKLSSRLSKVQADNQLRFQQLEEGMTINNTGEINQLSSSFESGVTSGDYYEFIYLPESGTNVLKNHEFVDSIPGLAFKKAFFGIFLSDNPIQKNLKKAMLGG